MTVTEPNQIHERFLHAVTERDMDAMMELYAPDGVAVDLGGGECVGHDAIRSMLSDFVASVGSMSGTTRKLFVAGDVALSSASWTAEFVGPDGSTQTQTGITAEVLVRQPDGSWRMVIDDPTFL